ncbi:MAG TPA: PorP/SprF family type IX secretion system membrane protein [Puia sp.]|nr:PorP/SprF family type IX secretion system membrane protein [Puia sp.]
MKRIIPFLICIIYLLPRTAAAQDPAFSQFFVSPLTLNPALTGKFNGIVRVAGNYRDQWPQINNAFVTSTISIDGNILGNRLPDGDAWGIGVLAMTDRTANSILTSNYFSFSTAYQKALDENGWNQLGIGFQGTYANKRLDGTKLNFEDELDQQGGWTIPSEESIDNRTVNLTYFDLNAGLLFNGSTDGNNNYYFGASVYHITKPTESFLGNSYYELHPRVTFHGGGSFPLSSANNDNFIHLSGLYSRQANATNAMLGAAWSTAVRNDDSNPINVYLGVWARFSNLTDAVIPYVGLDFGPFSLGLSYDVNVSSLKSASESQGGIEVSLIYIKKHSDGKRDIPCPKF